VLPGVVREADLGGDPPHHYPERQELGDEEDVAQRGPPVLELTHAEGDCGHPAPVLDHHRLLFGQLEQPPLAVALRLALLLPGSALVLGGLQRRPAPRLELRLQPPPCRVVSLDHLRREDERIGPGERAVLRQRSPDGPVERRLAPGRVPAADQARRQVGPRSIDLGRPLDALGVAGVEQAARLVDAVAEARGRYRSSTRASSATALGGAGSAGGAASTSPPASSADPCAPTAPATVTSRTASRAASDGIRSAEGRGGIPGRYFARKARLWPEVKRPRPG
jgi:hypothetical protein